MTYQRRTAAIALCLSAANAHAGPVVYVDDDAPPDGDGLSWATAYRFLQDGSEDLDGSGVVDFGDLLLILGAWGPC